MTARRPRGPHANCSRNSWSRLLTCGVMKAAGRWAAGRATGTAGPISPPPMRAARACCSSRHTWAIGNLGAISGPARLQTGRAHAARTRPAPDRNAPEFPPLRGVETLVVGEDMFAFVEIIRRLQAGATVALLVDRPPAPTAVKVELFGKPFLASNAAAELARASGSAIVPTYIVRQARPLSGAHAAGNRL